ncbi:MAG: lipoyl synthase [Candidatus Hydrothermota bacterium]|nr:MAG: lipoyl synthase [Candidatus Hydrothermae bacterium]
MKTFLRKPEWLKVRIRTTEDMVRVSKILKKHRLHTVCEEARCPNIHECWGSGTATFMILGDVCTRNCRFCAVKTGHPRGVVDHEEPQRVAQAVREIGLNYAIITSVTRDDLSDGGASIFAQTVREIKSASPDTIVEALIPDYLGEDLKVVLEAGVDVLGHNIEVVRRLTPKIRDRRASYERSLEVLRQAKAYRPDVFTKSGLMVGIGETEEEVYEAMRDLRAVNCDILTIGQYLQPTPKHVPVDRYVTPDEFKRYEKVGLEMGFLYVASGPLVRSSYKSAEYFVQKVLRAGQGTL